MIASGMPPTASWRTTLKSVKTGERRGVSFRHATVAALIYRLPKLRAQALIGGKRSKSAEHS
ncbi:hypothetical protein ACQUFD_17640, partial [Enterococcus gallinarum]|uniref:hypothetical protein n=1 Tax=Enterococcus gallinarum TaxID=1353 RepID=UPI003D09E58C